MFSVIFEVEEDIIVEGEVLGRLVGFLDSEDSTGVCIGGMRVLERWRECGGGLQGRVMGRRGERGDGGAGMRGRGGCFRNNTFARSSIESSQNPTLPPLLNPQIMTTPNSLIISKGIQKVNKLSTSPPPASESGTNTLRYFKRSP